MTFIIILNDNEADEAGYKMQTKDAFFTARFLNSLQFQKETFVNTPLIDYVKVYPVPATSNRIAAEFVLSNPASVTFSVYDMTGRTILITPVLPFEAGIVRYPLSLPENIQNGTYVCVISSNRIVVRGHFTIQK